MRYIISIIIFYTFISFSSFSQEWSLPFSSKIVKSDKPLKDASITLMQGNKQVTQITTKEDGFFMIRIPSNGDYTIFVTKIGHCTKKFQISTKGVPDDKTQSDINGFNIESISLFEPLPDIDYSILNQPLVKIKYIKSIQNFDYDEAYSDLMLEALDRLRQLERDALIKQKALDANYLNTIKAADRAFQKKDWTLATTNYNQASKLKPFESYPKDQVILIQNFIKDQELLNKKIEADKLAAQQKAKAEADALAKKKADEEIARIAKEKAEKEASDKLVAQQKAKAEADALAKKKADEEIARIAKEKAEKEASDKLLAQQKAKAEADALAKKKADEEIARIAKEKAEKEASDKLAAQQKAKAEADALAKKKADEEIARIAKEKAEREASDKLVAQQKAKAEADALAKKKADEEKNQLLKKYQEAISKADKLYKQKEYKNSKIYYEEALMIKAGDFYAKNQLLEIEKNINSDEAISSDMNSKQRELLAKYAPGVTEETIVGSGVVIIQRVVVKNSKAYVYQKKIFSWGGISFFRDALPITESTFEQETKP